MEGPGDSQRIREAIEHALFESTDVEDLHAALEEAAPAFHELLSYKVRDLEGRQ
jgi:hypothetical protein